MILLTKTKGWILLISIFFCIPEYAMASEKDIITSDRNSDVVVCSLNYVDGDKNDYSKPINSPTDSIISITPTTVPSTNDTYASPKWERYNHSLLGESPNVIGCLQGSTFWINVEQTLVDYNSFRGLCTWTWTQMSYMRGILGQAITYPVSDKNVAEMLCVASDSKALMALMSYTTFIEGPFFAVSRCYWGTEEEANETFSLSFKEKYPQIKEVCLVAPNFPGGVELVKVQEQSHLEGALQNNGIVLKYGPHIFANFLD